MWKKIIYALITIIVLIAIAAIFYVRNLINAPQPDYSEDIQLKRLSEPVEVIRDNWGMPHIYAQNMEDLYRTLGYVMAQDRLWQMDLLRRATTGRLSEIFGKDFVETDLLLRSLKIPDKSKYLYDNMADSLKDYLTAFSDGVNQYIRTHEDKLPLEFKVLGYSPELWKPEHSLNLVGYMAWDLGMGWRGDLVLAQVQEKVDSARFAELVPNFDGQKIIYDYKIQGKPTVNFAKIASQLDHLGVIPFTASNNWAVAPAKSKYGKPIVCNDMHLGFSVPGIWYQVHMVVKGKLNVTGVSIPGAPTVVAGHNEHIAWGMTNVMLDDMDFYIEKVNKDKTMYMVDGKWRPFKVDKEVIYTKEGDTVVKKLLFTHRGPVISGLKGIDDKVISAAWTGYDSLSNEYLGTLKLNFAKNWDEFNEGVKYFCSVSQNIVYGDDQGNIGIHMGAAIPLRVRDGYLPYPGDTSLYDWKGWVPYDQLPYEFNPKRNFVASANNKSANDYPYYITQYYYQDYRYDRIAQMLEQNDTISVQYMEKIQTDQNSKLVEKYLPKILFVISQIQTKDETINAAIAELTDWDGNMSADKAAPLIFEEFYYQFLKASLEDELGEDLFKKYVGSKIFANTAFANLVDDQFSPWFDDITTKDKKETQTDIMISAFTTAVNNLKDQLGDNPHQWQYQQIHTLTLEHPLGKVKLLDKLFGLNVGPYGVGGSHHTVSPYAFNYNNRYKVVHGASQRHIFVVGDWDKGMMIIPTGESGLPGNEFYCSQTEDYLNGVYRPDAFSREAVEKVAKYKRKFVPSK